MAHPLHGRWRPQGAEPGADVPFTEVELRPDGKLRWALRQPGSEDSVLLDYRIEGGFIVTRGEGDPAEARTGFSVEPDGTLLLEYRGHQGRYVRAG